MLLSESPLSELNSICSNQKSGEANGKIVLEYGSWKTEASILSQTTVLRNNTTVDQHYQENKDILLEH